MGTELDSDASKVMFFMNLKNVTLCWVQWLKPIIQVTMKAEILRILI
jgi:hypothetical protein